MARLVARGKYIFDGDDKFHARGVSYGPFRPNSRGERYPEPERAAEDFALMREMGVNVIRTYVPPPDWMFELAANNGLKLMVGIPWPFHMAFLDSHEMSRDIRRTMRSAITAMRPHRETIFAYILGNEVRSDIVRWHGARRVSRFLSELRDIGKNIDSEGLFTYANYPSTEYLQLNFLDLVCFNVYLHNQNDYRRYLTHLMGLSGERPLVLSESGMDTIREGEAHQAELLTWQSRAAFELGLSGYVVFAFTDEWHTGGSEITDWAFGLVTRERVRKQAFSAVARVFDSPLPPPLAATPKVSIVVAAYNAERSLARCLDSLKQLNYPAYETVVVDDGSTDSTAEIAERAGVSTLRREHSGLSAARNAGIEAACGELIAFIDADAIADRDWLYHLVETATRSGAVAAGGPNFPPRLKSAINAAIAAAPGVPREVLSAEDRLAQLCGCNMMVRKSTLDEIGGFDPIFVAAGDDVDLSWRLLERDRQIAYAPGAVVIHERRPTLRAYLAQQRGYGRGEALLFRKYPRRRRDSIYGAGWMWPWNAGHRIYYGALGRGLFQTIYATGTSWIAETPLTFPWFAVSLLLIICGSFDRVFAALGLLGLLCTIVSAVANASTAVLDPPYDAAFNRALLAGFWLLGPLARGFAYWRERSRFPIVEGHARSKFQLRGWIPIAARTRDSLEPVPRDILMQALRAALIRRGAAVAVGDGFEPFDLEILITPMLRIPLNALVPEQGEVRLRWRLRLQWVRMAAIWSAIIFLLLVTGQSWTVIVAVPIITALVWAAIALPRIRRIGGLLAAVAGTTSTEGAIS
ncbi:MAG TPA: glycosyltransferase [Candidatus Binataceae bacterium]|nr:glycosyltransferase [Candidatus Binataceae bacterium]